MARTRSKKNIHPVATRSKSKRQMLGHRFSVNQQRIICPESMIDTKQFENAVAQKDRYRYGGYIEYLPVVNGQRSGVKARLNREMLRTGTSPNYSFPFLLRRTGHIIVRGHLLARVLGGRGDDLRNLVPIPHCGTNLPMYHDVEKHVWKLVRDYSEVFVEISVKYRSSSPSDPLSVLPKTILYTYHTHYTSPETITIHIPW